MNVAICSTERNYIMYLSNKTESVHLRLTKEEKAYLTLSAMQFNMTPSELLRFIIDTAMDKCLGDDLYGEK